MIIAVKPYNFHINRFSGYRNTCPLDLFLCRHFKGWSLSKAAKMSDLSEDEIEDIELSNSNLDLNNINRLAAIYGIKLDKKILP